VGRLLLGRHTSGGEYQARVPTGHHRLWARAVTLAGAAAVASLVLPSGSGFAAAGHPSPSLGSLLARAQALSNQINSLNEQANGLRIQLQQARAEVKVAQRTYTRDLARLEGGRVVVGQLAAQSYMNGGLDSSMELFASSSPQTLIDRAAIMQELQQENGDRVSQIAAAVAAAQRAQETAKQQSQRALQLSKQIAAKQRQAQSKIRLLNSAVFAKAMEVFRQTGQYPNVNLPTGNTIGEQALRWALTRRGDPYVWGAAGAGSFDCSGLVLWAYAQVGISLPHFTGDQWNMGVHVPRNDLQPGDLVFFYPDISHVGLYIGNGLMVDAPDFGEVVQVEPVMWDVYVGAVRIVG
jgi:peptidoglycan DL-endopeptidase CwlO